MKKKVFYKEIAYLLGLVILALGTALMERAEFGVSMVVAPAYLIYLKMSQSFSFFTFGMAEYLFQGCLLILMIILLRQFRTSYLFSFVTAVIYGFTLDGAMWIISFLPGTDIPARIIFYVVGLLGCSLGVSLLFHTYISPEVYELWVKEMSRRHNIDINRYKTGYDCVSCLIGVVLSFLFFGFGRFEGVKIGTILCALCNGFVIGRFTIVLEKMWIFKDGLSIKKLFQ